MCCSTFRLDMASLLSGLANVSAAAPPPQHAVAIMGEQWETEGGREPGAVPHPHTARAGRLPFACCQKRDFSLHLASALSLTSQLGRGGLCCDILLQGSSLNLKKKKKGPM